MRTTTRATPTVGRTSGPARRKRRRLPVLATALAVAAGGCGGGSGGSSASSKAVSDFGRQKYTAAPSSPLADYFGYGDPKKQEALAREQEKKQQDIVAACMREQGFEYIAFTQSGQFFSSQETFGDLTRAEFAAKWGFGISTTMSATGEPVEGSPFPTTDTAPEDPNQKIRQELSDAEGAAYEKALYGSGDGFEGRLPPDSEGGTDGSVEASSQEASTPDFASMGCQGKAYASQSGLDTDDEQVLQKAYEDLGKRIEADSRVKAATVRFRACMAAAGFPEVKRPEDVYEKVSSRMGDLYGAEGKSPDSVLEGSGEAQGASESREETISRSPVLGPGGGGPRVDAAKLKKLQRYELSLAKAELPCRAAFTLATQKVQEEYEQAFLAENKALLDKAKAAGGLG